MNNYQETDSDFKSKAKYCSNCEELVDLSRINYCVECNQIVCPSCYIKTDKMIICTECRSYWVMYNSYSGLM